MSDALTSFTQGNDSSEWPFVTLPNFDIRSKSKLEKVTGSENTIFAPIVPSVLKKQWQQYAIDHQEWIKDDLFYRERTDVDPGLLPRKIYPFFEEDDSIADFTLPLWQAGPVPKNSSLLMVDLYTHPSIRRLVDEVLEVQHVMLSEVVDRGFLPINVDTLDGKERRSEFPRSYAVQPVFEDFVPNSEIVAFVIGVVPWDSFFVDSLPLLTSLEVKVEDKCGSQFSLLVNGPNVEFLGETFQHNNQERSFSDEFAEFARYDGTSSSNAYLEECTYTVTIYPTSAFAEAYKTNLPFSYALVAVAVFVFTACVFLLYDLMVRGLFSYSESKSLPSISDTTLLLIPVG